MPILLQLPYPEFTLTRYAGSGRW